MNNSDRKPTQNELILEGVIQGMSEGVLIIGLDGRVQYSNPAAASILDIAPEELASRKLASVFYKYRENERFNQTIIEAILDPEQKHYDVVSYYTGTETRQLHVMTSILWLKETRHGIIMMLSDVTELASLRIRYAQHITALLDSMVKALSSAIEERSRYTANHTRNMVKMADAFLDWLDAEDDPARFDESRRRAFLMSVWLHDVGKLTIPLEVMDKATRLGSHMSAIEQRLDRIHLLDRIAMLEGKTGEEEFRKREDARAELLENIRRIDTVGFLRDEDLEYVRWAAGLRYREEDGAERPVLTEEEVVCLQIRKGTLTDEERRVMQSHVEMTKKILDQVEFPEEFASVPGWASAHHELVNGSGYPEHKQGDVIPPEVRLLTILDIFEALTAADRPYKHPIPLERSLRILHSMEQEGCLDPDILHLFEQSRAWEVL